jgi:hypothetical protein
MTFACAYNLFGHKTKPDLYCAVPEDRPVPHRLDGRRWRFTGRLADAHALPELYEASIRDSARRNGYVLFFAARRCPRALAA